MKKLLPVLALSIIHLAPQAYAESCSFKLDHQEYWEDASGELTLNGTKYRCNSQVIQGDLITPCYSDRTGQVYFVSFDGAEGDFSIGRSIGHDEEPICSGVAN